MKKRTLFSALAIGCLVLSGCASKKDLENCQNENRQLTSEYQSAKETIAANNARIKSLEDQLAQAKASAAALQGSLDRSLNNADKNNVNISKLVDQINESNQYIRHLVEVKTKSDSLNMVLTNNLTRSLSREELKEVDVQVLKGVVISALGAVMDVAMSISSALTEVHTVAPERTGKDLFRSGMNIGRDMVGTMTNTLILAFLGSGLTFIIYLISLGLDPRQLISSAYVATEVISGISSSIGVILAVPLTALITAFLLTKDKKTVPAVKK